VVPSKEMIETVEAALGELRNDLEGVGLVSELDAEHDYTQAHYDEIQKLSERFAEERNQLADRQHQELFGAMERAFMDVGNSSGIKYLGGLH
jgi:hypothetical protein